MTAAITRAFALPTRITDAVLDVAPRVASEGATTMAVDAKLVRGQYTSAINAMAAGADASNGAALFSTLRTQLASAGTRHTAHAPGGSAPIGELARAINAADAVSTALKASGTNAVRHADISSLRLAIGEFVDRATYRAAHGTGLPA